MNPDESPLADELSALLEACDEALAAGAKMPVTGNADPALRPLLSQGVAALQMLQRLRPGRVPVLGPGPRSLGRFLIRRELGKGSFGVVHLARDPDLRRDVALKVPHGQALVSADLRQRFQQEARAAGALDHPNVVPVYESGEIDGILYIASAYCPGDTLANWLRRHPEPVPPRRCASVLAALAAGVHHAHERGILHRDLKPGNVLLQEGSLPRDRSNPPGPEVEASTLLPEEAAPPSNDNQRASLLGTPRITDFGLARFLFEDDPAAGLTRTGVVVGTPSYMAPEQASGSKEIGSGADVYGLGAILYELLTRRPPFAGESHLETLDQVRGREPIPPRHLRPGIPRDLETICLKCLHKDPGRRYPSAEELRLDLERYLAGKPIVARPVGPVERAVRAVRRHPAVTALAVALVLVTLAGVGGVVWKYLDAQEAASVAREKAELATEQERLATAQLVRAETAGYALLLSLAQSEWRANRPAQAAQRLAETPEHLRHWEYRHMLRMVQGSQRVLHGHTGATAVAASPQARWLASGGADRRVRLWDLWSGQSRGVLDGHSGAIRRLAASPDGGLLASSSTDRTARIWEGRTGKPVHTISAHGDSVEGVAFSRDGRWLATCSLDRSARVFEVGTWQEAYSIVGHPKRFRAVVAGEQPGDFALAEEGGGVLLWNPATGTRKDFRATHADTPYTLAMRPEKHRFVTASMIAQAYQTWLIPGGRTEHRQLRHRPYSIAVSPPDKVIALGLEDGSIQTISTTNESEIRTFKGHSGPVLGLEFVGPSYLVSAADDTVRVWHMFSSPEYYRIYTSHTVVHTAFGPNSRLVACVHENGVYIQTVGPEREPVALKFEGKDHTSAAFHPDGRRLAVASKDGVKLWGVGKGDPIRAYSVRGWARAVAFSPEGNLVATTAGRDVVLFDVETGALVRTLTGHRESVGVLAFNTVGSHLVSGSDDGELRLWNLDGDSSPRMLRGHRANLVSLAVSREGIIASGSADNVIKLWDFATGAELDTLTTRKELQSGVHLAFSPDGRRLAAAHDYEARLWDVATRQVVFEMPPAQPPAPSVSHIVSPGGQRRPDYPSGPIRSINFSPDGRILLTADGTHLRFWLTEAADGS